MSRKVSGPNRQILEEASTWFVAFRSQELGGNARQDFHDWLKRSPEHIRTYLEIASIYADIPAPEHGRTPPDLIARARSSPHINVVSLSPGEIAAASAHPVRRERLIGSRAVAAVVMLAVVAIGAWSYAERNTYETTVGEQRALTLPDGSIVELNARSKVRVAFHDRQRDVELLEGQALFRVAEDHSRPFVVHAGATSVRAVGTQFDVYRKSTGTTVTVLEGRVAVLSRTSAPGQADGAATGPAVPETPVPAAATQADSKAPIPAPLPLALPNLPEHESEVLLAAGEQMTVTSTHAEKAERPNIAAATAWTQHQLIFDGTPLNEVLEEFSRYTSRRLIVDSPRLANLKISGQYTSASPDSLLRFLSLQKGVVITEVDGETHIRQE